MTQEPTQSCPQKKPASHRLAVFSIFPIMAILVSAYLLYAPGHIRSQETITIANLHEIQAALEKASIQGRYAKDINEIVGTDLLTITPVNPFTGKPMREIRFGDEPYEGEFTYIPVTIDGAVRGYYLIAYGSSRTSGIGMDTGGNNAHVIIRLAHEWTYHAGNRFGTSMTKFPTFDEAVGAGTEKDWVVR